jgi:DNA modification methylase
LKGNYAPQHELIIFGVKGKGKNLNFRPSNVLYKKVDNNIQFYRKVPNKTYNHSTIKPIEILDIFIRASLNEGDLVLDMYAGSFSLFTHVL